MTYATVASAYRIIEADLDPFQLLLVGVALELSFFIAETPTGALADVYSRKKSLIIGFALVGFGFILEGAIPIFITILLAQVVWGVPDSHSSAAPSRRGSPTNSATTPRPPAYSFARPSTNPPERSSE